MIELTQQNRDNYENLKDASKILHSQKGNVTKDLQPLIDAVHTNIISPLGNLAELEERLTHIDAYLLMQDFLQKNPSDLIIQATQRIREQSALIKESLQDIKDADLSRLDDLEFPCADAEFFRLIEGNPKKPNIQATWTKNLLADRPLNLNHTQITQLTDAWGSAVSGIIKDAQDQAPSLPPGTPDTIARFFCIHEELEDLYDKVSNLVA